MPRPTPLQPRHGKTLRVLVVARISGCQNQKELSLDDQIDHAKEEIADQYDGPCEFRSIATKGKGERLDRPELAEVERLIRSGEFDVVLMEDVGRMVRGTAAVELWGIAVDRGMRCLAPNDGCDTAEPTWEEDLIAACKDHVSHCAHTSRRIKQKQMNRFKRNGGALPLPIVGYIKPEGAKHYSELERDETATPFLREGAQILKRIQNWSAVADYFNQSGFPTGPYCRRDEWNGVMVKRLYHNPILIGRPQRGEHHSVKHNETGRRISVKNPEGPIYRDEPHLAFFSEDELVPLIQAIDEKNKKVGRSSKRSRQHGTRKRTRFPGQRAVCWYCGEKMVWGGHGVTNNLMCNGARNYTCWNSFGFNGVLATQRVLAAINQELFQLEGINAQFRDIMESALSATAVSSSEWNRLRADEDLFRQERENVMSAIRRSGYHALLDQELTRLE